MSISKDLALLEPWHQQLQNKNDGSRQRFEFELDFMNMLSNITQWCGLNYLVIRYTNIKNPCQAFMFLDHFSVMIIGGLEETFV